MCEHLLMFLIYVSKLLPDYMASHPICSMMMMMRTMTIMIMRAVTVNGHNRNLTSSAQVFSCTIPAVTVNGHNRNLTSSAQVFSCTIPNCHFFFHRNYIPGWGLTSTKIFHHSPLDCPLILQFLHPIRAMSSSNSLHHLKFGLPLLLSFFLV